MIRQIGLGGSCHWCMEAVFQSLKGVHQVQQGWIALADNLTDFSEAVLVHFDEQIITAEVLMEIHLATHSSTANHAKRNKYRSAVYVMDDEQHQEIKCILETLMKGKEAAIITVIRSFGAFKSNTDNYLNYYRKDPQKPFCKTWIEPKLQVVLTQFAKYTLLS